MTRNTKVCSTCKAAKASAEFYIYRGRGSEGLQGNCKDCCRLIYIKRKAVTVYDPALPGETWKDVVGFEGIYKISSKGRVRSVLARRGAKSGRILVSRLNKHTGYLRVTLKAFPRRNERTIHSLVAEAFIGPRPEGFEVNHIDGDKLNNAVENLEYLSHSDNMDHAYRLGLWPSKFI